MDDELVSDESPVESTPHVDEKTTENVKAQPTRQVSWDDIPYSRVYNLIYSLYNVWVTAFNCYICKYKI